MGRFLRPDPSTLRQAQGSSGFGALNDDFLFYLESRGLPEAQARAMLIQAFVAEAFECVDNEVLREAFAAVSAEWLGVQVE